MFFTLISYCFLSQPALASLNSNPSKLKQMKSGHSSLFFQNSSKKSYLLYQAKQRELELRNALAFKKRQKELKILRKKRELKNKLEELEFQSYIHPDKILSLSQKLSGDEKAFWNYYNQMGLIEVDRKRAFTQYKQQYKNHQKRKKSTVQSRLKATQILRKKFNPVENSPFENL